MVGATSFVMLTVSLLVIVASYTIRHSNWFTPEARLVTVDVGFVGDVIVPLPLIKRQKPLPRDGLSASRVAVVTLHSI
jgi:hypothetical protein